MPTHATSMEADHAFETYLDEHDIKHTLCKIERFYQTYEKHRWRFDSLDAFVEYYNDHRPHQILRYDNLETPTEAFNKVVANCRGRGSIGHG